jgi:hypothetical protein
MPKVGGSSNLRRSARINVGCPVAISGKLPNNIPFKEQARVVTVSKYGAKMLTRLPLKVGMHLKIQPLLGKSVGVFKVVWVGREGTPRAGEVGVEYAGKILNLLGVNFPPDTNEMKSIPLL